MKCVVETEISWKTMLLLCFKCFIRKEIQGLSTPASLMTVDQKFFLSCNFTSDITWR